MARRPNTPIRWIDSADGSGCPSKLDSWLYWRDRLSDLNWWDKFPLMANWKNVHRADVVKFFHEKLGTTNDGRCPQCGDKPRYLDPDTGWKLWCLCEMPSYQYSVISKIEPWRSGFQRQKWGSFDTRKLNDLAIAKDAAYLFASYPTTWLTYSGKYHIGKSHLLNVIATSIGPMALYVYMPNLQQEIFRAMNDQELPDLILTLQKAPILLLDDLAAEHNSQFIRDVLLAIIGFRFNNPMEYPLAITTNLTRRELKADWGRIGARLTDSRFYFLEMDVPEYQEEAS